MKGLDTFDMRWVIGWFRRVEVRAGEIGGCGCTLWSIDDVCA